MPLSGEAMWVRLIHAIMVLFLVLSTFLWVKHVLFLDTFAINIAVVMVHVLFHCFVLSINCYLNPWSLLLSLRLPEEVGGRGVAYLGFNFQLVLKPMQTKE